MADLTVILHSIIDTANKTTGANDTNVTDAVQTLINGYGETTKPSNIFIKTLELNNENLMDDTTQNYCLVDDIETEIGFMPNHMYFSMRSPDPIPVGVSSISHVYGTEFLVRSSDNKCFKDTKRYYYGSTGDTWGAKHYEGDIAQKNDQSTLYFKPNDNNKIGIYISKSNAYRFPLGTWDLVCTNL